MRCPRRTSKDLNLRKVLGTALSAEIICPLIRNLGSFRNKRQPIRVAHSLSYINLKGEAIKPYRAKRPPWLYYLNFHF